MSSSTVPLRLGFDAKRAFFNPTGLGNYSRGLLQQLCQAHQVAEVHLFSPKPPAAEATFLPTDSYHLHLPPPGRRRLYRQVGLLRDLKTHEIDLYHGLSHELPLGIGRSGITSVVSMHDVIFRHHPDHYPMIDRWVYEQKWRHACREATMVVAISQATGNDLQQFYRVPDERLRVIYQQVGSAYWQPLSAADLAQVSRRHDLPAEPFWLSVGSLTVRKNLLGLFKAMALLQPSERLPVVVVGQGRTHRRQLLAFIHRQGLAPWVLFRPEVSTADLPALYRLARGLVYPSLYEGFGLPIVEALTQGTPAITSDSSAMPEAAGPGGLLIDPTDPESLADALRRLSSDEALHQELSQAGLAHVQQFRPEAITRQWFALYHELCSR
jgi:glycosyltransferase involved in cell wall biosynthesis